MAGSNARHFRSTPLVDALVTDRPPAHKISGGDVQSSVAAGLGGLLARAVANGAPIESGASRLLVAIELRQTKARAEATRSLDRLRQQRGESAAPVRVLKGPANGWLYEEPTDRWHEDIDLWLSTAEWSAMSMVLSSLGQSDRQRTAIDRGIAAGVPPHEFTPDSDALAVLDMHFNPYGLLPPIRDEALLAEQFSPLVPALGAARPNAELALVVAAMNLARKEGRVDGSIADTARLLRQDLDWKLVTGLLEAEGLVTIVGAYLHRFVDEFDLAVEVPLPSAPISRLTVGPFECLRLDGRRRDALTSLSRWLLPTIDRVDIDQPYLHGPGWRRWLTHTAGRRRG